MSRWKGDPLSVACPECGAKKGKGCHKPGKDNLKIKGWHKSRSEKALEEAK